LNIYFCKRLFGKVLLIEKNCSRKGAAGKGAIGKSVAKKVRQENCDRKSVVGKPRQKKCGKKSAVEKLRQKNRCSNMVGVYL
jgi:hypothetical protein